MAVKKLTIPTTFTDTTLPVLDIDPVIAQTGALHLIEPGHPENLVNPFVTADLVNGFTLKNLVYARWHALYGASTEPNSRVSLQRGAAAVAPHAVVEKTSKGGIHLGFCQEATSATRIALLNISSDLKAYLNANPTHAYFWSVWGRVTRAATQTGWGAGAMPAISGTNAGLLANLYARQSAYPAGAAGEFPSDSRRVGFRADGGLGTKLTGGTNLADTGAYLHNVGVANIAAGTISAGFVAEAGDVTPGAGVGAYPSSVFYRSYIEDLTVSGRSYATVDALDWAEYQKQVKTAGGRYFGDTFTDPATLT